MISERQILEAAVLGLAEEIKRKSAMLAEIQARLDGATPDAERSETAKPKRRLSAAGRNAIAEAARKRWTAVKAAKGPVKKAARKFKASAATKASIQNLKKARAAKAAKRTAGGKVPF